MALPELNDEQKQKLEKALEYINEQQKLIMNRSEEEVDPSSVGSNSLMISHHLSLLCRIYLGNVYFELTEKDVCAVFDAFGHIKSVSMGIDPHTHKHKGYCFIEYDVPESAYLAIERMTGKEMGNRLIKVGRPSNFPTDMPVGIPKPIETRMYISNVHDLATEEDVKDIFSPFGQVKAVSLVPDMQSKKHKGYGFVEFEKKSSVKMAIANIDGVELAGKSLQLYHSIVGAEMPPGMSSLNSATASGKTIVPNSVLQAVKKINKAVKEEKEPEEEPAVTLPDLPLEPPKPTIVLLENMIVNEIDAKDTELISDIREECSNYGVIKSMQVYVKAADKIRVFLEYENHKDAAKARLSLLGRFFGGSQIEASYYPKKEYRENYFDGEPLLYVEEDEDDEI